MAESGPPPEEKYPKNGKKNDLKDDKKSSTL
jgi:hypothetical protein